MAAHVGIGPLQCVDEVERNRGGAHLQAVGYCLVDVPVGLLTRNDWLDCYPQEPCVALRTQSRKPSK